MFWADFSASDPLGMTPAVLKLDISGHHYKLSTDRLASFPESLLPQLVSMSPEKAVKFRLCTSYDSTTSEYFFDRPVHLFPAVLAAYQTGSIHLTGSVCIEEFRKELLFWRLPTGELDFCCVKKLSDDDKQLWLPPRPQLACPFELQPRRFFFRFRRVLWYILEKPGSSKVSVGFMLLSLLFVLASMCILVMGTIPVFQSVSKSMNVTKSKLELLLADDACVAWFTLEYLLRLLSAPSILAYVVHWSAIVDLLSFAPSYIEIGLSVHNSNNNKGNISAYLYTVRMIGLLRVFRCLRLVKLVRYSPGLLAIARTLRKSFHELMLMVLFALVVDLVVSTLMYFLEAEIDNTPFNTIPAAAWWGIVTITTVGYGDMVPTTVGGKLVASLTVMTGILTLSLPVSIIAENFGVAYAEVREEFAADKHISDVFSLKSFLRSPWLPQFEDSSDSGSTVRPEPLQHRNNVSNGEKDTDGLELWKI